MSHRTHVLPNGQTVVLVPREQLRRKTPGRTLRVPSFLPMLAPEIPTPPAAVDWSRGRTIPYPILGNDREGDCYLCDALHCIQTWTGNNGTPASFGTAAVLSLYHQMSGGDNGLSDADVFPRWKSSGFFGHKILDEMSVDPRDDAAIRLGLYLFGGGSYTASLLDTWQRNIHDGATWGDDGIPDPTAGHAMHLSGYTPAAYQDETWGLRVNLTPAGLKESDPEVTVQFSLEWFNSHGYAPNGLHYVDLAALWHQLGGAALPASPFPPPVAPDPSPAPPTPTPAPIPATKMHLALSLDLSPPHGLAGTYTLIPSAPMAGPLAAHPNVRAVIADVAALFLAYTMGNLAGVIAAAERLIVDLGGKDPTPND
jgi:hypothetical protein